jgi:hypothetical protein
VVGPVSEAARRPGEVPAGIRLRRPVEADSPAYPAYDGEGEDRVVFLRDIAPAETTAS